MSVWTNTITNKGLEMLNGAMTGGTIRITKAVGGSASVALTELMQQVTMAGQEQTLSIQPVRTGDDGTLEIPVVLTNLEITEAYNLSQIGLFANHPEEGEILFALAQIDEKKKVPTNAESPGYTIEFYFKFKLTNATNITIETPGPYATLETVERMIGDITAEDVGAVPASKFQSDFVEIIHQKTTIEGEERIVSFYFLTQTLYWRIDVERDGVKYRLYDNGELVREYDTAPSELYLPLTGGTLSGSLYTNGGYGGIYSNANELLIKARAVAGSDENLRYLALATPPNKDNKEALRLLDNSNGYNIFGEHNKPTGAYYRGTGDATKRTIDIGGIGELLWIKSANALTFVWDFGGVTIDKSAKAITYHKMSELCFEYGVLTIATTSEAVNSASNVHYYGYVG